MIDLSSQTHDTSMASEEPVPEECSSYTGAVPRRMDDGTRSMTRGR